MERTELELARAILKKSSSNEDDNEPFVRYFDGNRRRAGAARPVASYAEQQRINTYGQARDGCKEHDQWIRRTLSSTVNASIDSSVVFAYISSNSVDFFLSALACTGNHIHATPALINVRWTASEIARALEARNSSRNKKVITIFVYTSEFEVLAKQSSSLLKHETYCFTLPRLTKSCAISSSTSDNNMSVIPGSCSNRNSKNYDTSSAKNSLHRPQLLFSQHDAIILFTSGTSGGAKGVRLSHGALIHQSRAKCNPPCGYWAHSCMLATTVPFFHVGGLSSILAIAMARGTLVLPEEQPKVQRISFDPNLVWNSIDRHAVNTLVVVPAMIHALMTTAFEHGGSNSEITYPHVDLVLVGGQSASPPMVKFLQSVFTRARLVQTYACTEAASSLTFNDLRANNSTLTTATSTAHKSVHQLSGDCIGVPPPHVQVALLSHSSQNDDNKNTSPRTVITMPYVPGVIATRGPHVMNGYWNRGGENDGGSRNSTQKNPQEWFVTNDLAYWGDDESKSRSLFFCGRVSDSIRSGGETVLAHEVERVLLEHPSIDQCAVFALPDDRFGEAVSCAIVLSPSSTGSNENLACADLRKWCAKKGLAGYKRPQYVFPVLQLPRNSSGKILKFQLKSQFADNAVAKIGYCKL